MLLRPSEEMRPLLWAPLEEGLLLLPGLLSSSPVVDRLLSVERLRDLSGAVETRRREEARSWEETLDGERLLALGVLLLSAEKGEDDGEVWPAAGWGNKNRSGE